LVQAWAAVLRGEHWPLEAIVVASDADGAPRLVLPYAVQGEPQAPTLSLSHRAGAAFALLADDGALEVGADIELIEQRDRAFAQDFFTADELAQIAAVRAPQDLVVTAIWSAKEAALKALRLGLRVDTRSVSVRLTLGPERRWLPFQVKCANLDGGPLCFEGWWQWRGSFVLTAITSGAGRTRPPVRLETGGGRCP
jgi:4'-phosphopantetheinyl transferase